MKKILYLSNLRLPTEKAYGIQIAKMCEAFSLIPETELELAYPYRKNPITTDFFEYYSVKKNFRVKKLPALDMYTPGSSGKITVGLKSFISAVILFFYALSKKADVIYSRDELIIFFLSFFKKNLVFEAHRFSIKRKIFYNRFKKAEIKIIAISEAIKKDLVNMGFESKNILVAHDGVDINLFDIDIIKEEARAKTNLPKNQEIVMYTGHLFEWKGAGTLLEVARMSKIKGQRSDFLFVFVGGTEYDVKQFRKKAEDLDNVLILGYKPHKEIPVFLKAADVLVLPNSASEKISSYTSPLKLFEYMSSGRPIVASELLSIKEILNSENSVLVGSDDPESLVGGISKVIENSSFGEMISQKAKEDVKNYTWQKRAERIVAYLGFSL